jgi:hypothetical protein
MKRTMAFAALALLGACGDDSGTGPDSTPPLDARADAPPLPEMPALGATQIDRMGRAAINTATNGVFLADDNPDKAAMKDAYNQAADQTTWLPTFLGEVTNNLAIIDSLNSNADTPFDGCGDQPGFVATAVTNDEAYSGVAGLALDDRLYVNTDFAECFFYLGVEAAVLGLLPSDEDCGGRVPFVQSVTQDAIDISYQVLAGDPMNEPSDSITDGIDVDDKQQNVTNDTFPFLAAP